MSDPVFQYTAPVEGAHDNGLPDEPDHLFYFRTSDFGIIGPFGSYDLAADNCREYSRTYL